MLPSDLEDWLSNEGDRVVHARAAGRPLSRLDRLIYEIWLLDTEARNGGLSQYFANCGATQWRSCAHAAMAGAIPSFAPFAVEVDAMIDGSDDPYHAINRLGTDAENTWARHDTAVVSELKAAHERAPAEHGN